jgi:lysophospholipase L1-like esterase
VAYLRYVALGDSQTEGLNDGNERSGYRGWADLFAEQLASVDPATCYANLAIRGNRAAHVRAEQLAAALALEPDLASVMVGVNDMLHPGYDVSTVMADLEATIEALTKAGARVITFTFPDFTRLVPISRRLRPRLIDFNDRLRELSARYDAVLVDAFTYPLSVDPRMWSTDRIHATELGHRLIAAMTAETLGLPGNSAMTQSLPPLPPTAPLASAVRELVWIGTFLGPWALRRMRGRSTGDGRTAKRPHLMPVRRWND